MNWYFPHIPLLLIAVIVWASRHTLRTGRVDYMGKTVRRDRQPVTFWAFVVTQIFWIAAMVFALIVWVLDVNGMWTG